MKNLLLKVNGKSFGAGLTDRVLFSLVLLTITTLVASLLFATKGADVSVSGAAVIIVAAVAAFVIGSLLGFIFSIPRTAEQRNMPENREDVRPNHLLQNYRPNTNLEQISDWLTKILIGATIVQLSEIDSRLELAAAKLTLAIYGGEFSAKILKATNPAFGYAFLVCFFGLGFIISYLWTRRYASKEFVIADFEAAEYITAQAETGKLQSKLSSATDVRVVARRTQALLEQANTESGGKIPALKEKPLDPDDPWKGRFGGSPENKDEARKLSATVEQLKNRPDYYAVVLEVNSTNPEKPLRNTVRFYLHPTFPNPIQSVTPVNGKAVLTLAAWGAFTVGVSTDDNSCLLELNLAAIENAPLEFRSR